jgi:hypothetical protein
MLFSGACSTLGRLKDQMSGLPAAHPNTSRINRVQTQSAGKQPNVAQGTALRQ